MCDWLSVPSWGDSGSTIMVLLQIAQLPALIIVLAAYHLWLVESLASPSPPAKGFGTPKTPPLRYTVDDSCQPLIDRLQRSKADLKSVAIGVSLSDTNSGRQRGLYATKNIKGESIICKIPSDLALALSDPANGGLDCPTMAHNGASYLRNFRNQPDWDFYTSSLPTSTPPTPDMFSDEELALLEWPWLVEAVKERQEALRTVTQEDSSIDASELQQATALVASRSFAITVAEDDKEETTPTDGDNPSMMDDRGQVITKAGGRRSIRVLLPLLDMANHSGRKANARMTIIDPQKDEAWFALTATRSIRKGEEICLFYGDTSDALLLNYGFVDDHNSMDKYMVKKNPFAEWTTTLEEDKTMLQMMQEDEDDKGNLESILKLRIQLKQAQLSVD